MRKQLSNLVNAVVAHLEQPESDNLNSKLKIALIAAENKLRESEEKVEIKVPPFTNDSDHIRIALENQREPSALTQGRKLFTKKEIEESKARKASK